MNKVNFMSYNSTGFDKVKADWIRGLLDTFNVNCFQLQEHFKASKTSKPF